MAEKRVRSRLPAENAVARRFGENRLLAALRAADRALLEPHLQLVDLAYGDVLFEPGDDVVQTHFPLPGVMASLVVLMSDGRGTETATVGCEGAIGGIVSAGHKPAFARASVQLAGPALRIDTVRLEEAKQRSASLRDLFSRYADALLAQVLQSVACNALHTMEGRLCRWLLSTQARVGGDELALTQETLAEMLGVHRATMIRVARPLQERGLIRYRRGRIRFLDQAGLEEAACECHGTVARHFARVLPEIVPQLVAGTSLAPAAAQLGRTDPLDP